MDNRKDCFYTELLRKLPVLFLLFLVSLIFFSSCSESTKESHTLQNSTEVSDAERVKKADGGNSTSEKIAASVGANNADKQHGMETKINDIDSSDDTDALSELQKVSRNSSGLVNKEKLDFSQFSFNARIANILKDPTVYRDNDYKIGLVEESENLLISERFRENIIQDIQIGTSIETVKSILGNPSFSTKDYLFYKTKQYYLGFKGKGKVEQAIIRNSPKEYNSNILSVILKELNKKDFSGLNDSLQNNPNLTNYFERSGHIEGGGWYAESYDGITVQEFSDDNNVTINNNFEGDLYKYADQKSKFNILFENEDYIVNKLIQTIDDYIDINTKFSKEGMLSPSGKLNCIYDWIYALSQYFTIRTMDNGKPDSRLSAMSKEYKWIDDHYILFIHAFYNIPYIVKVDDNSFENINVFYKLGIIKEEDPSNIDDYDIKIIAVKDGTIVLEDQSKKKTYIVNYIVDKNNKIELSSKK